MIMFKERILDFLPHRAPFVMVDSLVSVTAERFESEFEVADDNVLVADGAFSESGLLENIAQTCAAGFGYLDSKQGGQPKIGYIGAMSRVDVHALPPLATRIRTVVVPTHQLGNIVMVSGKNYLDGQLLLECEMKIVITE
jgi:predicted hotdog family 3-hydroxylacyl-ACP dehydratase